MFLMFFGIDLLFWADAAFLSGGVATFLLSTGFEELRGIEHVLANWFYTAWNAHGVIFDLWLVWVFKL